jgi:hypothetical protein
MKPVYKYTLIGLLVVGLVGITAVGIAYAQGDPPHPWEALAEFLGLTEEELKDQLQDGKTPQELADDAGINLEEFRESMQNAWEKNFKSRIQEALADDEISQDHANWLTEGLEKGFLGGNRMGDGLPGRGRFEEGDRPKPFGERPEWDGECKPGSRIGQPRFNQ